MEEGMVVEMDDDEDDDDAKAEDAPEAGAGTGAGAGSHDDNGPVGGGLSSEVEEAHHLTMEITPVGGGLRQTEEEPTQGPQAYQPAKVPRPSVREYTLEDATVWRSNIAADEYVDELRRWRAPNGEVRLVGDDGYVECCVKKGCQGQGEIMVCESPLSKANPCRVAYHAGCRGLQHPPERAYWCPWCCEQLVKVTGCTWNQGERKLYTVEDLFTGTVTEELEKVQVQNEALRTFGDGRHRRAERNRRR